MKMIKNIVAPKKLFVLWQAIDKQFGKAGERFLVGEISNEGAASKLRYYDNADTAKAVELGFKGLTTYPFEANKAYNGTVADVVAKRLPPDSRSDYENFLNAYRIPLSVAEQASPLTLLANTTGSLTGDGFTFLPSFEAVEPPFEFVFEIAGFRHHGLQHYKDPREIKDKAVELRIDNENKYDNQAVAVVCEGNVIGHLPKGLQVSMRELLSKYGIAANIERINGTLERPNILVFVEVR